MQNIGLKRSLANPCLYYKWERGKLVIMISWIDDNMILGPEDLVIQVKADLIKQFECDDCGNLKNMLGTRLIMLEMTQSNSFRQCYYRATVTSSTWRRNATTHQLFQELCPRSQWKTEKFSAARTRGFSDLELGNSRIT
jgi:hypothetical protein